MRWSHGTEARNLQRAIHPLSESPTDSYPVAPASDAGHPPVRPPARSAFGPLEPAGERARGKLQVENPPMFGPGGSGRSVEDERTHQERSAGGDDAGNTRRIANPSLAGRAIQAAAGLGAGLYEQGAVLRATVVQVQPDVKHCRED